MIKPLSKMSAMAIDQWNTPIGTNLLAESA
jgi:hypothetical protein